jgi:glycerophosphoryl diester phosphodiesterase
VPDGNPWLARRVINYAHQGGSWEWPSSTLFAIGKSLEQGATAVELDVHATADGELVVCHDATVDRTTDGHGAIATMTLAELRRLDNAYWFVPGADVTVGEDPEHYLYRGRAPDDPDFRVPTLREVLEAFPGVVLNLDVKQTAPTVESYEEPLARLLAEYERIDDVIVASFLDLATERFAHAAPHVGTSAGMIASGAFWRALQDGTEVPRIRAVALQVPEHHGEIVVVDRPFVEAAHAAGIAVHVWTVNDRASMCRLLDLGVDGIVTDVPTTLAQVLEERGAGWRDAPGAVRGGSTRPPG